LENHSYERVAFEFTEINEKIDIYSGLEGNVVFFEGDASEGTGLVAVAFGGAEYYVLEKLALNLDMGPALLVLWDGETKLHVTNLDIIANMGVNYYF